MTIDFISRNFGNQQLADGRPLLGFSVETEGPEAGDSLGSVKEAHAVRQHNRAEREGDKVVVLSFSSAGRVTSGAPLNIPWRITRLFLSTAHAGEGQGIDWAGHVGRLGQQDR